MSWPLFAVIQLALVTLGVSAAFWLRNRELKTRYRALEAQSVAAEETVAEAAAKFEGMADAAREQWLSERISACTGDDPVSEVQRLVLQNERSPHPEFAAELQQQLASGSDAHAHYQDQWRSLREQSHALACRLTESYPLSQAVISQLYEAFAALDKAFSIDLPPLPDAPEREAGDDMDLSQEAEHLRAANELLQQQLEEARAELNKQQSSSEDAEEHAEDLKKLLQQFTKDSRDMMGCIQDLERENARLKALVSGTGADTGAPAPENSSNQETPEANHAA